MGEEAVAAAEIDDAASTEETPHAPRHFPRFVQLLAWQTPGVTDGSRQPAEQRVVGKAIEIAFGEPSFGRR